jgi:hypothetical protein
LNDSKAEPTAVICQSFSHELLYLIVVRGSQSRMSMRVKAESMPKECDLYCDLEAIEPCVSLSVEMLMSPG